MSNKFYITTTLPYVNDDPHVGHTLDVLHADVIARWERKLGKEVFFNFGTDEHGQKIYEKAVEAGKDPQDWCDHYAIRWDEFKEKLNISYNNFIRTTDQKHIEAAQEMWRRCEANGDIYKKNYKRKYCVGCESEMNDSDLVNGECPDHPGKPIEIIEEENYFFRWSAYGQKLLEFYEANPDFVLADFRFNEIKRFVERGLNDFSISRLKSKMPWGIGVPGDDEHVMYVWFDALTNYISALDWPNDTEKFEEYWGTHENRNAIQICGKDNLRFQTAMWQAMLMSAGVPNSKQILVHGHITSKGQKMSKTIGNTVNPYDLVEKYGTDAVRYYFLAEILPFDDGDFTYEKFEAKYSADLANGLGNLVSRTSNMLEKDKIEINIKPNSDKELNDKFAELMKDYKFNEMLKLLWDKLRTDDEYLSEKQPWKMEDKDEIKKVLEHVAQDILNVVELLQIFMPDTAEKVKKQFSERQVKKGEILFPRI